MKAARLIRATGTRLVPVKKNARLADRPLDLMLALLDAYPRLGKSLFPRNAWRQSLVGDEFAFVGPEILTRLAEVIRERFRLKGQVKAASAHGRLTATILMLMPIATMLALLVVSPGYLQGMAKDSDGRYLIAFAIIGQFLGNYFIRRIINIKV